MIPIGLALFIAALAVTHVIQSLSSSRSARALRLAFEPEELPGKTWGESQARVALAAVGGVYR